MFKTISWAFVGMIKNLGMKYINAIVLASILFININGVVLARVENKVSPRPERMDAGMSGIPLMQTPCQTSGDLNIAIGDSCSLAAGSYTFDSITVSGTLILMGDSTTTETGVTITTNSMTVSETGVVTANGQGYTSGGGEGMGNTSTSTGGGGAGYGGAGGNGSSAAGGHVYGNNSVPLLLGSGGGRVAGLPPNVDASGGSGGGAIRLIVANQLTVNGTIASNGLYGSGGWYSQTFFSGGGGSGGSIWITAASMIGNGVIEAKGGGVSNSYAGGGGGGRIAIYTDNLSSTIQISVDGGGTGNKAGDLGTYYPAGLSSSSFSSTLSVSNSPAVADGNSTVMVTVTLKDMGDNPIQGQAVDLAVASGPGLSISGQEAVLGQFVRIGVTDSYGVVNSSLKATVAGTRVITARSGVGPIQQTGTVEFTPGAVDKTVSHVIAYPASAPADGETPITVTVFAYDAHNNPIPEAEVSVSVNPNGNATISPSSIETNEQGRATIQVKDTVGEALVISAVVNNETLDDKPSVTFLSGDLSLSMAIPENVVANSDIQYAVKVRQFELAAENVMLTVQLPLGVTYVGQNSPVTPTQNGQTLDWALGAFDAGERLDFTIFATVTSSLNIGDFLQIQAEINTTSPDSNSENNSMTASTQIVDGRSFSSSIEPVSKTVNPDAEATYSILIENTGLIADTFTITVKDGGNTNELNPAWYTLSDDEIRLAPGETELVDLTVNLSAQPDKCVLPANIPFSVNISSSNNTVVTGAAEVNLQLGPVVTDIYPESHLSSGSTEVMFSWRTDAQSMGILHIQPVDQPDKAETYAESIASTSHSTTVTGLSRDTTYEWYIEASSDCDTTTTPERQISIDNAVVFNSRTQSYTIPRDYDQTVQVAVTNRDSVARDVHLKIEEPYEDLLVDFRGSGSVDGDVRLLRNETRSIELVIHAQDAENEDYYVNAILTSTKTDGTDTVSDLAVIHIRVLSPGNYTIEQIGPDQPSGVATYRLTNHGQPITDLNIRAEDQTTHLPAQVMISPQIYHARVGTGESIDFKTIPLYGVNQQGTVSDIPFDIVSEVKNVAQRRSVEKTCNANVYAVTFDGPVSMALPYDTYYCPNTEHVKIKLLTPPFVNSSNLLGGTLQMNFSPPPSADPHRVSISLNGNPLGSMQGIPRGQYSFSLSPSDINTGFITSAQQTIAIDANFPRFAHYQIGTGGDLIIVMDSPTVFVCANSAEEARQIAEDLINSHPAASTINVQIELPNAGFPATLDENGFVNVRAFVGDDLATYWDEYSVSAEMKYLDMPGTPTDNFLLFNDGEAMHRDGTAKDRYFNTLWQPRYSGNMRLTVIATSASQLTATATRDFILNAQPDFDVKGVTIEKIARKNEYVKVWAEIVNNGFTVAGPVTVDFRYYNATNEGLKVGSPLHTSRHILFDSILNSTFEKGESITVTDNTFVALEVHLYYVEVVVDPPTAQP